jgi:hypothetical protein
MLAHEIDILRAPTSMHKVTKTNDRYFPLDIGHFVHLWAPDI